MTAPESFVAHLPERLMCAAIHYDDGRPHMHQPCNIKTGYVVCGRRHHNCIMTTQIVGGVKTKFKDVQGFLTTKDRFLDRHESYRLAVVCGQIQDDRENQTLYSEDLW